MSNITLCLQEFPRTLPSGNPSGKGLYLTVYPSSRPNTDTIYILVVYIYINAKLCTFYRASRVRLEVEELSSFPSSGQQEDKAGEEQHRAGVGWNRSRQGQE